MDLKRWKALFQKKEGNNLEKKRNRNTRKWIIRGVCFAALAGVGILGYKNYASAKETAAKATAQRTAAAVRGNLSSKLSSSGTISPKDTYSITSLVEGEVIEALFEEGDQVEKDQILYQIDVTSMESQMKSAINTVTRTEESYESAKKDYEEALSDYSGNTWKSTRTGFIKELKIEAGDKVGNNTDVAGIYNDQMMKLKAPFLNFEAQAIGAGAQAILTLDDTEEQLTGVVTSVSNMDEVLDGGRLVRYVYIEVPNPGGLTSKHTAVVNIGDFVCCEQGTFEAVTNTTMKCSLTSNVEIEQVLVHEGDFVTVGTPIFRINADDAANLIKSFKDKMDTAEEKYETAQSSLDTKQDTYDSYTIKAPISGQVITKNAKLGDKVTRGSSGGSSVMAVIYDLSEVTFQMSIDELDIRKVKIGQMVSVTADALEGVRMSGRVTNISLESSQSNGVTNYPVTVTMDEVGELLPGMNVDGVIILDQAEDALMIPVDGLMRGNRVYVKDDTVKEAQGRVPVGFRAVEVKTGLSNDDYVQIIEGLEEGDEIYLDESSKTNVNNFMMGGPGGMGGMGGPGGMGGSGGNRGGSGYSGRNGNRGN